MNPSNHNPNDLSTPEILEGIAIVGMAGRFPGAGSVAEFWANLKAGLDTITHFRVEELDVRDRETAGNEAYVRARGVLERPEWFDAGFFGIQPQEAAHMDPQHRVFLECCWEALEDAGLDPLRNESLVGVFAGQTQSSYLLTQVSESGQSLRDYAESYPVGNYQSLLGNIPDTLATRVAYKLNLRGPSLSVSTACSTSLVAVTQAAMNLMTYACDVALAGGVSITFPQQRGYLYQAGGMVSPDGVCRTFDHEAQGTVFGSGAGVVALKRLEDAVAAGDHIYAVIKGCGVNNDGASKIAFTAPSAKGQVDAILMAQAAANVLPSSIGYIEAHGTATPLGDPIEVSALKDAFGAAEGPAHCALGSAKSNVGHLDAAAGITGLIKTARMLEEKVIPPTLHFAKENPELRLEGSPFFVATELQPFASIDGEPRRAGVSAFGVGGTNAHVVVEEAPVVVSEEPARAWQLLPMSAKSAEALSAFGQKMSVLPGTATELADAAYTLQVGRAEFEHRGFVVAREGFVSEMVAGKASANRPPVVFLFPGQGVQRPGMGQELYESEPVYREIVDRCVELLREPLGRDLREVMYGGDAAQAELSDTKYAQPAIFVTEYALAQLWRHWGIEPELMAGHSIGEFVAACLAGVVSLEDALKIVARRGALMSALPGGSMLSVRMPAEELAAFLKPTCSIAAINSPKLCVAAGPHADIAELADLLASKSITTNRLQTSHAFHSPMIEPIVGELARTVGEARLSAPQLPYLSCVTGEPATAAQATDPQYWARHARETVAFSKCLERLRAIPGAVLLEVGPGTVLQTLARQHSGAADQNFVSSLAATPEEGSIHVALGRVWQSGVRPHWEQYQEGARRCKRSLPTYAFQRKRYWVGAEPGSQQNISSSSSSSQSQHIQSPSNEVVNMSERQPSSIDSGSHRDQLVAEVVEILVGLSGQEAQDIHVQAPFLELGFDSLFLTQVSQALQNKFKTKVTLRQLLTDLTSVDLLAGYLVAKVPAKVVAVSVAAAPVVAAPAGPVDVSSTQQLMQEQLRAMNELFARQLEFLRGGVPAAPVPVAAPAVPEKEYKAHGPYKPIQVQAGAELSAKQQKHIDDLIRNYNERTRSSKEYAQKYRPVLADPRVVSGFRKQWKDLVYPIVTNRSVGSKLVDIDGNEYIDLLNGFGPIALGHRPEFLVEALRKQLDEGIEIGPQTPLAGEVATLLCELTGLERATFCNTGSEAVMAAMRLARTVTGRKKVVMFAGDYHGNFEEALAKRIGKGEQMRSGPIAPGIAPEAVANVVILDYGTDEALDYIRKHIDEIAAVMVEPVQSRHPELRPKEFLLAVREVTQQSGAALIFDEVVTGFRLHQGGAQAYYGIRADMATYGKVLGGGFPIGALAGSSTFMDALDGGMWQYGDDSYPEVGVTFFAGTFVRHPLAMAAAKSVLTYLKEAGPQLQDGLRVKTEALVGALNALFEKYQIPSKIHTCASWFYFLFPLEFRYGTLLYYHLRLRGLHIQEGFPCFLTTAHGEAECNAIVKAFAETLEAMAQADLLPSYQAAAVAVPEPEKAPLTEAQLEIWLSTQLSPEAACAYNESFSVRLVGELNREALLASLKSVVNRHQIFRARFDSAEPQMLFEPRMDLEVGEHDFSALGESKAEDSLRALIAHEADTAFDLLHGQPLRIHLVRLSPRQHCLVWTSHHIVCDGWSTNVLVDELSQTYTAKVKGAEAQLPPALPFGNYALRQHAASASADQKAVETYWLKQFEYPAPVLELPTDRPRPAIKTFAGATFTHRIAHADYLELKKAGARHGATMFALMLAGFNALLFRLTNQDDVVVGIPAAAQSLLEDETLVGHCVNFLALRSQLPEQQSFGALLEKTRTTLLDAYEHQTYTYGTLVRKLGIIRNASRLPLIEVQFNLERVGGKAHFEGLETDVASNPKAAVNFDLFLNIVESDQGLKVDCDYNTDLFDEGTIARWLKHYEWMLKQAARDMTAPVVKLPLFGGEQRNELIRANNRVGDTYPSERLITELISEVAAGAPRETAVVFEGKTRTFAELEERSNALASYLAQHGIGRESRVAVFLNRSLYMPEVLLGILKTGACYVPLDPMLPKDRVNFILQEASAKVVVTDEESADQLSGLSAKLVAIDSLRLDPLAAPLARQARPDDLAYTIYTSGSTGKPKGVGVSHRALVNFLWSMKVEPGLNAHDRLLAVTTLSFDIAGLEMFLPLLVGGTVVIASREATTDGYLLKALLEEQKVTTLQATPATWRLLLEAGWQPGAGFKMMCGGEALPRPLANQLAVNGAELWNMYGPTETTIWSAVSQIAAGEGPVTIGPPVANTQFYVVDQNLELTPPGVPGELWIGGDGVARGYYLRPELTVSRFLDDPFVPGAGRKVYRTGDLVRRLNNGDLEFLGRMDHQVKVRGFRIELGEIEAQIALYPGVKECVTTVVEPHPSEQRLAAYVAIAEDLMPGYDQWRTLLARQLPAYMIPSYVVRMDELPKTPNGKIDRKRLPVPQVAVAERKTEYKAPRDERETKLAEICCQVLSREQVGISDNLFELGADSLQIFQIAARASRAGATLTAQQLMLNPSIEALGKLAETPQTGKDNGEKPAIRRVSRENFRVAPKS